MLGEHRAEFRDGLNGPDLIVDSHNGGHENVVVERSPERIGVDEPLVVDGERLDDESLPFGERPGGREVA